MRTSVIHGERSLTVEERPLPVPGPGQVRLRTAYVGICGSDLSYYRHGAVGAFTLRESLVPGHEVSGIVDLDPSSTHAPGTPVTVHPATWGECQAQIDTRPHLWPNGAYLGSAATWPHTQGAGADFIVVRDDQIRVLPEQLSLSTAALAEPLGVGLHAIAQAGGVAGARVLVSGAGPIGLLAAGAALAQGAAEVSCSDVLPEPLDRARALGVTRTYQVTEEELPAEAFDIVLECSGSPRAVPAAIRALARGGTLVQAGMVPSGEVPVDLARITACELRIIGTFRFHTEIDDAILMLAAHPELAEVITHRFDATEITRAFDVAADPSRSGKVLLRFTGAAESTA